MSRAAIFQVHPDSPYLLLRHVLRLSIADIVEDCTVGEAIAYAAWRGSAPVKGSGDGGHRWLGCTNALPTAHNGAELDTISPDDPWLGDTRKLRKTLAKRDRIKYPLLSQMQKDANDE